MARYLVVGGSSGIGLELVKQLETDHEVHVISRTSDNLNGLQVTHHSADITEADAALPDFDSLDGLVYLPGSINLKPFHRLSEADFDADYQVNFKGAVRVIQHYLKALKQGSNPSITMVSTVAVQRGMPFHASIASAKGAIEGLTRALAAELAPTIRVNAIAPSLVETSLANGLLNTEAKVKSSQERHPLKRIGDPKDIASAIAYLLSEQSSWMTGQILGIDGGLSAI